MIGVSEQPTGSVVQSVDLYGDGGSIFSKQFIAQSVTSTGPLGDLTVLASQGLNNVTAPSIFGNIAAQGPLFGTIQTTGVRTDPGDRRHLADPRESRPRLCRSALRPVPRAVRHHHDDRGPGSGELYLNRPDHQPRQPGQLCPQRRRRQRTHRRTGRFRRGHDATGHADASRRIAGQRRVQRPARGAGQ